MNIILLLITISFEKASSSSEPKKVDLSKVPAKITKSDAIKIRDALKSAEKEQIEKNFAKDRDESKKQKELKKMSSVLEDWQKTIDALP